jgi:hypothetical protein
MRVRVTILGLMAAVGLVAVGFAALRNASALWASGLFTLAVALLSAAVLGAIAGRGRARMAWAGFAVFGWVYLGLSFGVASASHGVTPPPLLTKALLDRFPDAALGRGLLYIDTGSPGEGFDPTPQPAGGTVIDLVHFRRIGQTLGALLFGLVGAGVGRLFAADDDRSGP